MRRLFGAIARPVAHIESRSESLCVCHVGSLEGREGRTPRRRSPRRLYRVVSAGTDAPPAAPMSRVVRIMIQAMSKMLKTKVIRVSEVFR